MSACLIIWTLQLDFEKLIQMEGKALKKRILKNYTIPLTDWYFKGTLYDFWTLFPIGKEVWFLDGEDRMISKLTR